MAEYVRDQMEAQLRESGQSPPPGVELEPSPLLQRMTGHGELWVDANGLPRRQVVDLGTPEITEQYDARIHLVVDFDFGEVAAARSASSLSNIQYLIPNISIPDILSLLFCLALSAALTTSGRRRWVYATVAVTVSIILIASLLLQADGVLRFQARLAEAAKSTQSITEALGISNQSSVISDQSSVSSDQSSIPTQYAISNIQYLFPNFAIRSPKSAIQMRRRRTRRRHRQRRPGGRHRILSGYRPLLHRQRPGPDHRHPGSRGI